MQGTLALPIVVSSKRKEEIIKATLNRFPLVAEAVETTETIARSNLPLGKKLFLLMSFFMFFAWSLISSAWAYSEPDDSSKFKFLYDVAVNDFWASVAILVGLVLFIAGVFALASNAFGARNTIGGIVICGTCILAGALIAGSVGYVKKLGCLAF